MKSQCVYNDSCYDYEKYPLWRAGSPFMLKTFNGLFSIIVYTILCQCSSLGRSKIAVHKKSTDSIESVFLLWLKCIVFWAVCRARRKRTHRVPLGVRGSHGDGEWQNWNWLPVVIRWRLNQTQTQSVDRVSWHLVKCILISAGLLNVPYEVLVALWSNPVILAASFMYSTDYINGETMQIRCWSCRIPLNGWRHP